MATEGNAVTRAYGALREKIRRGELKPGRKLSQRKVAAELKCSTIPVCEAMRRLESEGLLVKEPSKMARIRVLSSGELRGLYLVREGLESAAIRLCIEAITDDEVVAIQEIGRQLDQATVQKDTEAIARLDMEFHQFLVRCARCPLLEEEIDRLLLIEKTAGRKEPAGDFQKPQSHRGLIQAISDRDAELAEYLMRRHIQHGYQELMNL